jgi:Cu+-exporting ATPase
VLVRNAQALETLAKIDTLVVDKTGTLTEGKPRVADVAVVEGSGFTRERLLGLAASVEQYSEHPLAQAIVKAARDGEFGVEQKGTAQATGFHATPGGGVAAAVMGDTVLVGTERFLQEHGVQGESNSPVQRLSLGQGPGAATLVFVAVNTRLVGVVAIADLLKESAREAIGALRAEGLRIVLLTGDRREAAIPVARALGIEEVEAQVPPDQKAEIVKRLRQQGRTVAMTGDGINDAPALAAADVGIAMGTGTDVAIESAGIVLVKGDLRGIVRARRLSRATIKNIRQNLAFAFLYNILGIPIAAGILYPAFGWLLSPMLASAAMSFSSVSVIANALRLRNSDL